LEDNVINIEVAAETEVTYTIEWVGVKKGEEDSKVIESINDIRASFKVTDEYLFVRARVISSTIQSNPFQEGDHEMAWTQPVMFSR
jgi:hypothetical protein